MAGFRCAWYFMESSGAMSLESWYLEALTSLEDEESPYLTFTALAMSLMFVPLPAVVPLPAESLR